MFDTSDIGIYCGCGRERARVHCPSCGSTHLQAYSKKERVHRDGHYVRLQAYWCRRCGRHFNEETWQLECHAPQRKTRGKNHIRVQVHSEQEKQILETYLKQIRSEKNPL